MNESRIMKQVGAAFGVFMTMFYLGVGTFLLVSEYMKYFDAFLRYVIGITFIFYGIYRGFRTWGTIKELYMNNGDDDVQDGRRKFY
jgi:cytochrome c biogenesis protein CcdA